MNNSTRSFLQQWLRFVPSVLLCGHSNRGFQNEISFAAARSKLAEILGKILKAELLRLGMMDFGAGQTLVALPFRSV